MVKGVIFFFFESRSDFFSKHFLDFRQDPIKKLDIINFINLNYTSIILTDSEVVLEKDAIFRPFVICILFIARLAYLEKNIVKFSYLPNFNWYFVKAYVKSVHFD